MNTESNFTVTSITFESNDPETKVIGQIQRGLMSYDVELYISQTQSNSLINQLQRKNDVEILDLIESNPMFNGETLFTADFSHLENCTIELSTIEVNNGIRQIRA